MRWLCLIVSAIVVWTALAASAFDFKAERVTLDEVMSQLRAAGLQVMAGRNTERRVSIRLEGMDEAAAVREIGRQFGLPVAERSGCYLFGNADTGAVMLNVVRDGKSSIHYLTVPGNFTLPPSTAEIEIHTLFLGQ